MNAHKSGTRRLRSTHAEDPDDPELPLCGARSRIVGDAKTYDCPRCEVMIATRRAAGAAKHEPWKWYQ